MQSFTIHNRVSVIKVNKCQNLHLEKKTPRYIFFLFFLQISIYEPFNVSSNKMLIVPLGIWETSDKKWDAMSFRFRKSAWLEYIKCQATAMCRRTVLSRTKDNDRIYIHVVSCYPTLFFFSFFYICSAVIKEHHAHQLHRLVGQPVACLVSPSCLMVLVNIINIM